MFRAKKVLIALVVFLISTAAWALTPRFTWSYDVFVPESIAPGQNVAYSITLRHTGIVPLAPTQQLRVVATGDIAPYMTIVQPSWPASPSLGGPPVLRGNEVDITLHVAAPQDLPMGVKRGEILLMRVLPNGKVKEVFRAEALPVELTFSSVPMPPDPGEAGKKDLLGIDTDQNGVRDDIDRYIVFAYPDSIKKREALKQSARSLSDYLRDSDDKEKTRANAASDKSLDCLAHVFDDDLDESDAASDELYAQFLNTRERSRAYARADAQMGGYVSNNGYLSERLARQKAACAFDVDALPN